MALVTSRLKHFCLRHVVITVCRKLQLWHYHIFQLNNIHSKFREYQLNVSEVEMGRTLPHARTCAHTNQHKHTQHTHSMVTAASLLPLFYEKKSRQTKESVYYNAILGRFHENLLLCKVANV